MSTFSGITGALSSLTAQRQALETAGQNIANANTEGYTRQRVSLEAISTVAAASIFSSGAKTGSGVRVIGIDRLADTFLDARLRTQTAYAARTASTATALDRLESLVQEPSDTGVASGLQAFWNAWQDVANSPDSAAIRTALLGSATSLTAQIGDTYRAFGAQWDQARTEADALVSQVNSTASGIADLNAQIRGILASGASANELMDERDLLVTQLSELVGATASTLADGTMTVSVGGNPLVQGGRASEIALGGSRVMTAALAEPAGADAVSLSWADGTPLPLSGGTLAGTLSSLQPSSNGGAISQAIDAINTLATDVATAVNAIHTTGSTVDGTAGTDFFAFTAGAPAALGLTVALSDPDAIAAAAGTAGGYDGSIADLISQIGEGAAGPDATWSAYIVDLGVSTEAARRRADVAEATRATAEQLQLSNASVDIDEEVANMVAYQTAYEAAARVMTAIDEMLDTLINKTGIVGR
ncbi:flagellar hook-associated protein FlgK [Demequina mangrovi]|uniref:Flagellar hook-associated protein 1 n=1 Tax=Demequina mangrovi TaxID=1043493 RepID=A0A1H6ZY42_9MICO|nr:flagellar hook-associated protein FlgK [Demequina mangrovi]SEJ56547.1 flagellar hook-associated protein 1 FlgK [Demequina mangrovi]